TRFVAGHPPVAQGSGGYPQANAVMAHAARSAAQERGDFFVAHAPRGSCLVEMRGYHLSGVFARNDRHDFERGAATAPSHRPLLEEAQVVALHELKAAAEVGLDPAVDVLQSGGEHPPAIAQLAVDRDHVVVAKALDDHEEHALTSGSGAACSLRQT